MAITYFVYLFYQFGSLNTAAINICVQVFVETCVFDLGGCITRGRISESCGNPILNFLEELPNFLPKCLHHSTFTLEMHGGSNSSHPVQHLLLAIFIIAILIGMDC